MAATTLVLAFLATTAAVPTPPAAWWRTGNRDDECSYLVPDDDSKANDGTSPHRVHVYNGSILEHSSLILPLTLGVWLSVDDTDPGRLIAPSSSRDGRARHFTGWLAAAAAVRSTRLAGNFTVPAVFGGRSCSVINAACNLGTTTYWNTNFTLVKPKCTPSIDGAPNLDTACHVHVRGNYLPCPTGGFRLKAVLHLNSFGVLNDKFCVGNCCTSADLEDGGQ